MNRYDDIINLKCPTSKKYPRMNKEDRAAQFAPFAALTGYAESINEAGRLVERKLELTEEEKLNISTKINYLLENKDSDIDVMIIYFVPDLKKEGGVYLNVTGIIKKVNYIDKYIELDNKKKIFLEDIKSISSNCFE